MSHRLAEVVHEFFFFFNDRAPPEIYPLSPPDALPIFQGAFDDWDYIAPQLRQLYDDLNRAPGPRAFELDPRQLCAPLPRAYQWLDASAYLPHVELVDRKSVV